MAEPPDEKAKPVSSRSGKSLDDDAHWYLVLPDGRIETRFDANLRDAKKDQKAGGLGLFPSPTTIIGAMLSKPELEAWKVSTAIDGTLLTLQDRAAKLSLDPRELGENDASYVLRQIAKLLPALDDAAFRKDALKAGRAKVKIAQDFGTEIHQAFENLVKGHSEVGLSERAKPFFGHLRTWFSENVAKVFYSEMRMVSNLGVAGTSDLGLLLRTGERVVADIKTGNWREGKNGLAPFKKFSHPIQISSYRQCAEETIGPEWADAGGLILHVCSNKPLPVVTEHFFPDEMTTHFSAFKGLLEGWQIRNRYRPRSFSFPRTPAVVSVESSEVAVAAAGAAELEAAVVEGSSPSRG